MVDLLKLIEKELSSEPNSEELISLSKDIFQWYDNGGPLIIKDNLLEHLNVVKSAVSKNMKEITPEIKKPKKKAKKRHK